MSSFWRPTVVVVNWQAFILFCHVVNHNNLYFNIKPDSKFYIILSHVCPTCKARNFQNKAFKNLKIHKTSVLKHSSWSAFHYENVKLR